MKVKNKKMCGGDVLGGTYDTGINLQTVKYQSLLVVAGLWAPGGAVGLGKL